MVVGASDRVKAISFLKAMTRVRTKLSHARGGGTFYRLSVMSLIRRGVKSADGLQLGRERMCSVEFGACTQRARSSVFFRGLIAPHDVARLPDLSGPQKGHPTVAPEYMRTLSSMCRYHHRLRNTLIARFSNISRVWRSSWATSRLCVSWLIPEASKPCVLAKRNQSSPAHLRSNFALPLEAKGEKIYFSRVDGGWCAARCAPRLVAKPGHLVGWPISSISSCFCPASSAVVKHNKEHKQARWRGFWGALLIIIDCN